MARIENKERNARFPSDIEIFKIVTDHFRQDIREFWSRSNFYLLAQVGIFSVFITTFSHLTKFRTATGVSIAIFGLVIALFWFVVARGAIKWLSLWRNQVIKLDRAIDRFRCYVEIEIFAEEKPFLSPSYVTQFLPLVFVITWLIVVLLVLTVS